MDSIRFRLDYGTLNPALATEPVRYRINYCYQLFRRPLRVQCQVPVARLSSRRLNSGLETRPSTRLQRQPQMYSIKRQPQMYSIKRHPDKHIGPSPPCRYRQGLLRVGRLGNEHPRIPVAPAVHMGGRLPSRLLPPRLLVACAHPPKGRAGERNHNYRIISSTEFDRQVKQLAIVANRHHDPKTPAFSGYTEASSDGPVESAALPGMRRYASRRKPGEDRSDAAVFKSPLVPESVLRGEPLHRYLWRCFKAVCPHRCWRQPGPPIRAPSLAPDGRSGPSSGSCCDQAACRSSAGSRPAPGHVRRSCVRGNDER